MGTVYNISYIDTLLRNYSKPIDSILIDINDAVSTYIPYSIITQINTDSLGNEVEVLKNGKFANYIKYSFPINDHFISNYENALEVFTSTGGYFDPTIMPLVNYWGFGYKEKEARVQVDSQAVSIMKANTGLDLWSMSRSLDSFHIMKPPQAELDFSAIAKGYAVDEISKYLKSQNITKHIIEIGGEIFCSGLNKQNLPWKIGINRPVKEASLRSTNLVIQLSDMALASSGNYRNFYEVDGETYGHEINPHTGYPEKNDLLGVSVIAPDCTMADALATAFMVLGRAKSVELIEQFIDIEAVFFYSDDGNKILKQYSSSFAPLLVETDS